MNWFSTKGGRGAEPLRRLEAGDVAAFADLYHLHGPALYRFALRMSGAESMAEDVVQEVFLALMRGRGDYDPRLGTLGGYLFGMARRQVYRHLGVRGGEVPLDAEEDLPAGENACDPLAGLRREEQAGMVRQALAGLPPHYREVVVFCDMEEMSYAEAAEVLGCAVGTVRSRLSRARALLAERLRQARITA